MLETRLPQLIVDRSAFPKQEDEAIPLNASRELALESERQECNPTSSNKSELRLVSVKSTPVEM